MEKIGIIGSGTWGTAIAVLLRNNGHEVTLWSAIPAEIEEMAKTRTHKNLPGVTLPEGIIYTADLEEAMKDKNLLVMAVPSVFVRSTAQKMKPFCKEGQLIVDVDRVGSTIQNLYLTGPTNIVCKGEVTDEELSLN